MAPKALLLHSLWHVASFGAMRGGMNRFSREDSIHHPGYRRQNKFKCRVEDSIDVGILVEVVDARLQVACLSFAIFVSDVRRQAKFSCFV